MSGYVLQQIASDSPTPPELIVGMGVVEHGVAGQLPVGGLQLDQLEQGAAYGGGSIAGIEERIAHQGHE